MPGASFFKSETINDKLITALEIESSTILDANFSFQFLNLQEVERIAKVLVSKSNLMSLNVQDCGLNDACVQLLCKAILKNTSLTQFDINLSDDFAPETKELVEQVKLHLKSNKPMHQKNTI